MKKVFAILLALSMLLAMAAPAMAETGTITITNASRGQSYKVYKIFDAHYNATTDKVSYSVKDGAIKAAAVASGLFDVATVADKDGNYAVSMKDTATDAGIIDWVKSLIEGETPVITSPTAVENNVTSKTVTFNVDYGYYYISSSLGTVVTVDTNTPSVNVIDKNTTAPTIPADNNSGKKIVVPKAGGTDEFELVDATTAKIGDTVDYQISFMATNFETKLVNDEPVTEQITQYVVTDTPNALDIDTNSVKVKVGSAEISNYTVSESATGVMTITIPWCDEAGESIYNSPATVVITYSAKVTKDVNPDATNTAVIKYDGIEEDTKLYEGTKTVHTYQFELKKVDGTNPSIVLTGAQFELYDALTGGTKIPVVKVTPEVGDPYYRVAETGETPVAIEAGQVVIKGLKGGETYYLEEIKAPEGYNKLTERKSITISDAENATNSITVVNNAGSELPATGGIGTTIFYVVGGLLMAAAVVLLVTKKKVASGK